jgi:hypothetical protein
MTINNGKLGVSPELYFAKAVLLKIYFCKGFCKDGITTKRRDVEH